MTEQERYEEYHFYKDLKICVRCHKNPAEPKKVMCLECAGRERDRYHQKGRSPSTLQKDSERRKIHYRTCKENNTCPRCGRSVENKRYVYCARCRAKMKEQREKGRGDISRSERVAYGICYICGKDKVVQGKSTCENCYQKRLESIQKIAYLPVNENWKNENKMVFKRAGCYHFPVKDYGGIEWHPLKDTFQKNGE